MNYAEISTVHKDHQIIVILWYDSFFLRFHASIMGTGITAISASAAIRGALERWERRKFPTIVNSPLPQTWKLTSLIEVIREGYSNLHSAKNDYSQCVHLLINIDNY